MINAEGISPIDLKPEICTRAPSGIAPARELVSASYLICGWQLR